MQPEEAKQIRESLGLSRTELAYKLHVTEGAIRSWEAGKTPIKGTVYIVYRMLRKKAKGLKKPAKVKQSA
jgi:DNA-binding transcriptional regulator YiaG